MAGRGQIERLIGREGGEYVSDSKVRKVDKVRGSKCG